MMTILLLDLGVRALRFVDLLKFKLKFERCSLVGLRIDNYGSVKLLNKHLGDTETESYSFCVRAFGSVCVEYLKQPLLLSK